MIKVCFFDLGRVLLEFSHEKAGAQLAEISGLPPEEIWATFYTSGLQQRYESGAVTTEEVYEVFQKATKRPVTLAALAYACSHIFSTKDDVIKIVESLKSQGLKLVILSNTCPVHWQYCMEHYPFLGLFDDYILSYAVKSDDLEENIIAANRLGMRGFQFATSAKLKSDLMSVGIKV